ncbi:heat shock protein 81-3 [Actinidia rufa]|uniref:Heat shock protein 81-3 n=1 Tax=Actinidia rufa TaxID=165716 RepID=A0A7J0DH60_9ERIC|nr:heat shock protein 81-3 [Actinidia rufa]
MQTSNNAIVLLSIFFKTGASGRKGHLIMEQDSDSGGYYKMSFIWYYLSERSNLSFHLDASIIGVDTLGFGEADVDMPPLEDTDANAEGNKMEEVD